MKTSKISLVLLLVISLLLVSAAIVFASGTLSDDAYVDSTGTVKDGDGYLSVSASGGVNGCTPTETTFLKFNLSSISGEVSSNTKTSSLNVESIFSSGANASGYLLLWAATDNWSESTGTKPTPVGSSALVTVTLPVSDGIVSFSSDDLNDYLNQESKYVGEGDSTKGDDVASFIILIGECTKLSNSVFFDEKDGDDYGDDPSLSLFDPNSFTVSTIYASRDSKVSHFNWPVMAGLTALLVLVVAGLGFGVRRFNS